MYESALILSAFENRLRAGLVWWKQFRFLRDWEEICYYPLTLCNLAVLPFVFESNITHLQRSSANWTDW